MIAGPVPQDLACPNLCFPGLAEALRAGPRETPGHLGRNFGSRAPDSEVAWPTPGGLERFVWWSTSCSSGSLQSLRVLNVSYRT